jgi:flagellar protein FliO/FliZ
MAASGLTSLLWFIAILVMIPAALWLLKRTPAGARFSGAAGGATGLRSIAVLPLSASQRIVTVEIGHGEARRWLVLGVTAQSITTLHTLEPQSADGTAASAPPSTAPGFAHLLDRFRGSGDDGR